MVCRTLSESSPLGVHNIVSSSPTEWCGTNTASRALPELRTVLLYAWNRRDLWLTHVLILAPIDTLASDGTRASNAQTPLTTAPRPRTI